MPEQTEPSPAADPAVVSFIEGRTGLSFSPEKPQEEAEDAVTVGDESERERAVEKAAEEPPAEDTGGEEDREAAPKARPAKKTAKVEGDEPEQKADSDEEPDEVNRAYEAWKKRVEGRGVKSEQLKEKEQRLMEREEIVNTVLQTLNGMQQQQVQQTYEENTSSDPGIPDFEEDEAANLDARIRRIEEQERALAEWQQQQQQLYQQQQQQAQQVQGFVRQFAEDEQQWMQDSPKYAEKSKAFFEGTVDEIMLTHGLDKDSATQYAKQAVFNLAAQAYSRGEPPMAVIERLADRYMGSQAQKQQAQKTTQQAKPKAPAKPKLQQARDAVEDGGSLSQSRATAQAKIPMSIQEMREKNLSSQEVAQMVRQLGNGIPTSANNAQFRTNLFATLKELESA